MAQNIVFFDKCFICTWKTAVVGQSLLQRSMLSIWMVVVSWIMAPKEIQVLQSVNVTLYGDRNFAYGIKLRILSWIILMGLKRNHKNPVTGRQRLIWRWYTAGPVDVGRGHESSNAKNVALEDGKSKEVNSRWSLICLLSPGLSLLRCLLSNICKPCFTLCLVL